MARNYILVTNTPSEFLKWIYLLVPQSRLAQFWQDLYRNVLLLVIPTELEIFWHDLYRKDLLLVISTEEVEIFWQDLYRKALLLIIPTVKTVPKNTSFQSLNFLPIFQKKWNVSMV